ncbi:hypothetical protein F511_16711 [Dorcoceras hygrometricum]|uniref:Uncharacterized protein n=1 Tax=Dorcoceras hygrometricum TaxID=472368 RepID=A0A2Z7D9M7_9LAMI|nr:hypothetical protein F511_16711 [Dorcoceras hygrometricum]
MKAWCGVQVTGGVWAQRIFGGVWVRKERTNALGIGQKQLVEPEKKKKDVGLKKNLLQGSKKTSKEGSQSSVQGGTSTSDVAQEVGTSTANEEGFNQEDVRTSGAVGGLGATIAAYSIVGGMASAGTHLEESFIHWSGGPAMKIIEIREINWDTHLLPNIDPSPKGKELLVEFERPNLVSEHCTKVLKDIHEQVEPRVTKFDEWKIFQRKVRLNMILSMIPIEELTKIEDDIMTRAETDRVSELMIRRELIHSKMIIEFLEKSMVEHWESSNLNKPSGILLKFYGVPISTYTLMKLIQIKRLGHGQFYISNKKEIGFIGGNPSSHKGWPVSPSQLGGRHSNPAVTTPMIVVGLFRHDTSVGQSQRGSQSGHQSINLAQYISRKHGRTQPTQTSFLMASLNTEEAVLNLKSKANESCRSLGFHLAKKIEQHCYFAIFSKVELQPQMGSNRKSKANGYSEDEHPVLFLDVEQALADMPEDEDSEEGSAGREEAPQA